MKIKVSSQTIILISMFSALYAIFRMVPTFPIIGVVGAAFSLADVITPLYGILLGPYLAVASVMLGTFLAIALGKPLVFFGFDFLPASMNALLIGFLIRGWRTRALIINIILFILFLIHPYTSILVPVKISLFNIDTQFLYPWMHMIALGVLLSPLSNKISVWIQGNSSLRLATAIMLLSFIGTMVQHLTGNLLYETLWGMFVGQATEAFKLLWYTIFWLYPFERVFIIVTATIIGLPVIRITRKWLTKQKISIG